MSTLNMSTINFSCYYSINNSLTTIYMAITFYYRPVNNLNMERYSLDVYTYNANFRRDLSIQILA